jgi:hypothetical protein
MRAKNDTLNNASIARRPEEKKEATKQSDFLKDAMIKAVVASFPKEGINRD